MKTASRWMVLVILAGILALPSAGCQSGAEQAATNEAASEAVRITADQLVDVFKDANVLLLDVRPPEEIEERGTVEGYINIHIDELEARLDELPRDRPILTA